jgi:hypothetical protein
MTRLYWYMISQIMTRQTSRDHKLQYKTARHAGRIGTLPGRISATGASHGAAGLSFGPGQSSHRSGEARSHFGLLLAGSLWLRRSTVPPMSGVA